MEGRWNEKFFDWESVDDFVDNANFDGNTQ